MCGIAGWFGPAPGNLAHRPTMDQMLERIAHRGPDGRGVAALPDGVGMLGHVRLAIIDPSGGTQPMWSKDGRSVLAFNGEIYNFRELKRDLGGTVAWRTHSDTEVLLELLMREGPACLGRLRGMFAFAFWDGVRGRAVIARDPHGIKPLFIREDNNALWFASEAKAFPRTVSWKPELDSNRLHHLLNLRYPAEGHGLMRGVRQVAPGEHLLWTSSGVQSGKTSPDLSSITHDDEGVRAAVTESVEAHLVADVPLGCYLSGGLDSGVIAFLMARQLGGRVSSYTIDTGDDPEEARNAAETAEWLGVSNHRGHLNAVAEEALTWLLWHVEVPKVNALQSAAVAQLASSRVKVVLSGLGGDELFLGYNVHRHFTLATRASLALGSLAAPLGRATRALLPARVPFSERWRALSMLAQGDNPPRCYALLRNVWDGAIPRERIYGPRMLDGDLSDVRDWVEGRWPKQPTAIESMAQFEWQNKMVDDLLWQEDRTSMAHGLEVRVPFVDAHLRHRVANARRVIFDDPGRKKALRDAFSSAMPTRILQRPKSGFQLAIATEIDRLFARVISQWLSEDEVRRHGLFNLAFVRQLQSLPRRGIYRWHFFTLLLMAQAHRWIDLFENGVAVPERRPELVATGL